MLDHDLEMPDDRSGDKITCPFCDNEHVESSGNLYFCRDCKDYFDVCIFEECTDEWEDCYEY